MEQKLQYEKFKIGSICLFASLVFLTLIPVVMKSFFIFVDPNIYKFLGGCFILLAAVFYILSPEFYKGQLRILGINFIIFSIFQIITIHQSGKMALFSKYICFIIGIILFFIPYVLERKSKKSQKPSG